jgi:hypothetical protein
MHWNASSFQMGVWILLPPSRQVLEMERIGIGIGAGAVIGGLIWISWTSVPTQGIIGPSTTTIGSDELLAGGMLDDAAPALAVLEAAAGAWWTRATCTW